MKFCVPRLEPRNFPVIFPVHGNSAGPQILHGLVAPEQVEERAQCSAALALKVRVAFQDEAGVVMRDRDELFVDR